MFILALVLLSFLVITVTVAIRSSRPVSYDHLDYVRPIATRQVAPQYEPVPFPQHPARIAMMTDTYEDVIEEPVVLPFVDMGVEVIEDESELIVYGRGYADSVAEVTEEIIETVEEIYELADDTGEFVVLDEDDDNVTW
jgi:hypothetical protein